jgi:hypothetical protein
MQLGRRRPPIGCALSRREQIFLLQPFLHDAHLLRWILARKRKKAAALRVSSGSKKTSKARPRRRKRKAA